MKKTFSVLCGLFGFSLFISACFANANISVSPIKMELILNPGTFSTGEIIIRNEGDEDKDFQVFFEECVQQQNALNCSSYMSGGTVEDSFSFWIDIPEGNKKFTLLSNKVKKIPYTIAIPKSAKGGSYLGVIKASEVKSSDNNITSGRKFEVGSILILTVNADIQGKLEVGKAIITSSSGGEGVNISDALYDYINPFSSKPILEMDNSFNVKFDVPIKNSGNIVIKPTGKIEVIDNGKILENIGYKYITSEDNYILGNEIINYLPINVDGTMITPTGEMNISAEWSGFAYNSINQNGETRVQYHSPGQFFSKEILRNKYISWFYKLKLRENSKNLIARITINNNLPVGGESFIQEIPFTIKYIGIQTIPNEALFFWIKHILLLQ